MYPKCEKTVRNCVSFRYNDFKFAKTNYSFYYYFLEYVNYFCLFWQASNDRMYPDSEIQLMRAKFYVSSLKNKTINLEKIEINIHFYLLKKKCVCFVKTIYPRFNLCGSKCNFNESQENYASKNIFEIKISFFAFLWHTSTIVICEKGSQCFFLQKISNPFFFLDFLNLD